MRTDLVVGEADAGQRIDVVLAAITGITRSQVRRWIEAGCVRVNGRASRASLRVALGDRVEMETSDPLPSDVQAEDIPVSVLYEDDDLVVVDKPAGLVVHPAPGHESGTLVNALLHHCRDLAGIGGVRRPGIVHRLDRGTSGVLVVAKCDAAHTGLAEQFRDHSIERIYRALVRGVPTADSGRIDLPIGRHRTDRRRMSVHASRARESHTRWSVLSRFPAKAAGRPGNSWLEIHPETGRTHQIRVHLASAGLPIVGDPVYGRPTGAHTRAADAALSLDRPALHAAVLGFVHPTRGEEMRFEAELPPDLAGALETLAEATGVRGAAH